MKKISILAACAAVLLMAGCTSTGAAKSAADSAALPEHPMTYVLDLADTGDVVTFVDNTQYGTKGESTRQAKPSWTQLVKVNKPQAGDTVIVKGKFVSDMDLDRVKIGPVDDSAAVNYWLNLYDPEVDQYAIENIKAGEAVEFEFAWVLVASMVKEFKVELAYGEQNGAFANLAVERVCESDIGMAVAPKAGPRTEPKEFVVDISRALAFVEMKPEYPWENGVQNTLADPQHYQATVDVTSVFGDDLPIAGDVLTFTWNTKPTIDIAALKIRFVENTASVPGWWKEIDVTPGEGHIVHEGLKAGEKAEIKASLEIGESPIEGISFCITYDLDAGVSGCTLMFAK